jgi:N-acetylglucosaminyldiphosphoundecaprenol N-acetyl-beta-D-mannosaminyltransferase
MTSERVDVLGVQLYSLNISSAVKHVNQIVSTSKCNLCISATGAHGLIFAKKNTEFKAILQSFYINLPDGMPGVWVGRSKGAKEMERCYGPDFFAELMLDTSDKNIKHFLCGGMDGVADKLKIACEQKFNNHNIVGTFCPPFQDVNDYDYRGIADHINESGADIVWVGISTPKQEQFAWNLSKYTNVHFLITVGAAFDFHIGNVRQAPMNLQKMGLEWLFRLLVEPKRLWRRYIEIVPSFAYYGMLEVFNHKLTKRKK